MKIVKQTPVLLTLQYHPIGFWLIGGGLIIMGIGIFTFWSEAVSLNCHRESTTAGYCQQIVVYPFMSPLQKKFQLSELQKITVENGYSHWQPDESYSADKFYYHIVFYLTDNEKFALLPTGKRNLAQQSALAEQIKTFFNNPQQVSLTIEYSNHWLTYLLSSILIIMGWLVQSRQIITVTFDKIGNHLIIDQRRLFGIQIIQDLDNITVKLESSQFSNQLLLIFKSGEQFPLTSKEISKINNQNLADKITRFLT